MCVCSADSRAFSCVCGLQSNEDQQGEDGTDRLDGSSGTAQGSTLLSRELWSAHEGRQRLEKSPPSRAVKSPNFCWKYRKCFIPWGNLGCWLEQGHSTARRDGITSQSSVDLSHYPCVVNNAPAVRCNRRVWASNMPCRHLQKKHTQIPVWILYLCEDYQCISQPATPTLTPSQLNAWPYPKPLRPLMSCTATVSSLYRWKAFPALHRRTCTRAKGFMRKRLIFMYSSADAWVCGPPRALVRAHGTFQTSFRSTDPLQHLEAARENVMR